MYYNIDGIETSEYSDAVFFIYKSEEDKLYECSYQGDRIMYSINDVIIDLYDLIAQYVFGDLKAYYEIIPNLLIWNEAAGHSAEWDGSVDEYNGLVRRIRGKIVFEKYMMLVDLQGLLGSIQNLITAINSDFMNFYIQLTTIGEDRPSFETGTTWTSGYHCSIVFSLLTSYFTKAHSILDILTKLVHEFDKDPGTYSGLEKLRSKGILFGDRKWLSMDKVSDTVFDASKKNCVYEIESLRNELVHNGTWEALEKVYIETQKGRIVKRFIFWPDFRENRLAVSGNRNKFFSSGKTVNEELLRIHIDLLKRLEYTLNYIKHHFAESMPNRSFEEIMKMNISEAKQQIQSYYHQA